MLKWILAAVALYYLWRHRSALPVSLQKLLPPASDTTGSTGGTSTAGCTNCGSPVFMGSGPAPIVSSLPPLPGPARQASSGIIVRPVTASPVVAQTTLGAPLAKSPTNIFLTDPRFAGARSLYTLYGGKLPA